MSTPQSPPPAPSPDGPGSPSGSSPFDDLAIVLTGGGARAAYQVGLLRALAREAPELRFPIINGVSAGGINAVFLAAHPGNLEEATDALYDLWADLQVEDVFQVDPYTLVKNGIRWLTRLTTGGNPLSPETRGLVDTRPLTDFLARAMTVVDGELVGIRRNLERGWLRAVALTTLDYGTGQTVTWVQGQEIEAWQRPYRLAVQTRLGVDHVMASAALPLLFPAVRIGPHWYGDGGIRLAAPLSPALHLGARKVLAVSTRYRRSTAEASTPSIRGYPPPAQILGQMTNAIFLDVLDQDVERLERLNLLLGHLPPEHWHGMKPVEIEVVRPSEDLGRLAAGYEPQLPKGFRFLTRGLGTRETSSPDFLAMLMFQPDYLKRVMAIGEADALARKEELLAFLGCAQASPA